MLRLPILILLSFLLLSCSGSGSSSNSNTSGVSSSRIISGKITGNGYVSLSRLDRFLQFFVKKSYAAVDANSPDTILAIYNKGALSKEFSIASDGSFTIDLELFNYDDIVFFVINKSTKRFFGHLSLVAQNNEKLDSIDKSTIGKSLSYGIVDTSNNCSSSESTSSQSASFNSSDLSRIQAIARTDDALMLYMNNYKNQYIESYLSIRFSMGSPSTITGSYNQLPANNLLSVYNGMAPLFYLKSPLGTSFSVLDLYPPSAVSYSTNYNSTGSTANSSNPMTKSVVFNSSADLTTAEFQYISSVPSGDWTLSNHSNGSTLGVFQFAGANPFDSNNYFKAFIPQLKIVVDSNNNLTSVTVKLNTQGSDGIYTNVTYDFFKSLVWRQGLSYVLNGSSVSANLILDAAQSTSSEIVYKPSSAIGLSNLNRLIFSYYIGQAKYMFFFE